MRVHWQMQLLQQTFPLLCLFVQIFNIVLHVLEVLGVHHLQVSVLLQLFRTGRPDVLQLVVLPLLLLYQRHTLRSLPACSQLRLLMAMMFALRLFFPSLRHLLGVEKVLITLRFMISAGERFIVPS